MMIALDAQATLGEAGLEVEVAGTAADARRSLKINAFDAVVLDINLSGEMSFGVADDACRSRRAVRVRDRIWRESRHSGPFKAVPVVPKPYDAAALRTALSMARDAFERSELPQPGRGLAQGVGA